MQLIAKRFAAIALLLPLLCACPSGAEEPAGHFIRFADSEAMHAFFRYADDAPPIVQGHRGTRENGLPESSIAAMEYVLQQQPAIFEIDPRLTKDSVVVVFHDAKLDRTTDGTGNVADYTWEELQRLHLKNAQGEVTGHRIPTLGEVLDWARDRTVLILDKKDVPLPVIARMIRRYDANRYVVNMVRSPEDACYYYEENPQRMFSVSIREPETFARYMEAGIPPTQLFACIGTEINERTGELCALMREHGVRCLMATGSSYDKLKSPEERAEAYRRVIASGVTMLESNYPVEVGRALSAGAAAGPPPAHKPVGKTANLYGKTQ